MKDDGAKQQALFSKPEPTSQPDKEASLGEQKKPVTELRPIIPTQEIVNARPVFEITASTSGGLELQHCALCNEQIFAGEDISYSGRIYHKECAPFAGHRDTKQNPPIEVKITAQASVLALLLEVIELHPELQGVHSKVADALCEHDNYYIRCNHCGSVVSKAKAIFGGALTRTAKTETKAIMAVPAGKFFSKVRTVEVFCSPACDATYAAHLRLAWKKEQDEKAASAKGPKKPDGLSQLMKLAKTSPKLAAALGAILESVKADFAEKQAQATKEARADQEVGG